MKIAHGVNVDQEDRYDPSKEARANLNDAGRDRSHTQKGLDDMLFGNGAVRRRPRAAEQPQESPKPAQPMQKPSPVNNTKVPAETASKTPSILSHKRPGESSIGIESQYSKIESQKKPNEKVFNSVMTGGSLLNDKKSDHLQLNMESKIVHSSGRNILFNRPEYIRKLKKIAEEVPDYYWNNSKNYYRDVVRLYECDPNRVLSKQKSNFEDKEFPPQGISIGPEYRKDDSICWRRASEIHKNVVFGKYVDPNDIQLGEKSSANFMSILSCLAEREQNIKRLIGNQQENQDGFYWVRLFINSAWRYYSVDDFLAQKDQQLLGASSFSDQETQLSVSLIEKAYAKAYAGYNIFERNATPKEYLKDLTGSVISQLYPGSSNLQDKINEALQKGWTIIAVPRQNIQQLGIDHSYNLSVINMGDRGQLQIRNSWGTITERPKITFTRQGIFQLNSNQQSKYIDYFLIAQTNPQKITSTIQSRHRSSFYSCYTFTLSQSFNGYLTINQWDRRLFPEIANYNYNAFRVVIERRYEKKRSQYVTAGFSYGKRNLDLSVNLSGGQYAVYCIGSWNSKNFDYNLCMEGNQRIEFTKSPTTRIPNLIKDCLETVNLQNGKRSAKGHVDEHIMYHKDSNMVLLTLTNVSEKPYNYTQDLSKIKWDTLNIVNAIRQDEHEEYKGLMKADLAQIKSQHNEHRAWSLTLEPKESYTWVISTSQNYKEENFRNWGFR